MVEEAELAHTTILLVLTTLKMKICVNYID